MDMLCLARLEDPIQRKSLHPVTSLLFSLYNSVISAEEIIRPRLIVQGKTESTVHVIGE